MPERRSDRWMTPGVVIALILSGVVVILGVLASVTYLTVRGFDPQPVVQLAGTLVAAVGSVGTFVVGLVARRTTTKVERQSGRLASGLEGVLDELDRTRGRHAPAPHDGTPPAALGTDHGQVTESTQGPWQGASDEESRYADTPLSDLRDTAWYRQ